MNETFTIWYTINYERNEVEGTTEPLSRSEVAERIRSIMDDHRNATSFVFTIS